MNFKLEVCRKFMKVCYFHSHELKAQSLRQSSILTPKTDRYSQKHWREGTINEENNMKGTETIMGGEAKQGWVCPSVFRKSFKNHSGNLLCSPFRPCINDSTKIKYMYINEGPFTLQNKKEFEKQWVIDLSFMPLEKSIRNVWWFILCLGVSCAHAPLFVTLHVLAKKMNNSLVF